MQNTKVFKPEDFGALADGIHDDSSAVSAAIEEASKCCGKVEFAKDKVYYVEPSVTPKGRRAAILLQGVSGVSLKGNNTVIRVGNVASYFDIIGCSDITLDGFIFEMYPHVAFRGRLVSVCCEKVCAVIKTDYEIPLKDGKHNYCDYENGGRIYSFAMPDDQWRTHLFLRSIEKTDKENEYTVWFDTAPPTRLALRRVSEKQCDIIMPTPDLAHKGCSFLIHSSRNIHIENCNIKEAPQFVGAIKGNRGEIYFENVKLCCEADQTIPMVGWRDGYHCKDNRGPIHWKNCDIGRLYDDAFNISCTYLVIDDQPEPDVISIRSLENNGAYYGVCEGDIVSIYDTFRGVPICEARRVVEVIKQHGAQLLIRLDTPILEVDREHTRVVFDNLSAPGSTVENCRVEGTVRCRGPITVRDTEFKLLMMWIENEAIIEGPVPRDMLFENCSFKGTFPVTERYMENYLSLRTVKRWPGVAEYKLKNIRFVNCSYDPKYVYVEEGNGVEFIESENTK